MIPLRSTVSAALAAVALVAMATPPAAAQNRDRNLITQEELERVAQRSPSLYQAVRSLRSHMVDTTRGSSRGVRSMDVGAPGRDETGRTAQMGTTRNTPAPTPVLYVDGRKIGHLTLMRDILTTDVAEVKYLDPTKAQTELGLGHDGGAILVKTRGAGSP